MLGAALDINTGRPAPWWQAPEYAAAEAGSGISRFPALVANFRTGRHAITGRPAGSIPSDTADALAAMEGVDFSALFDFSRPSAATYVDSAGCLQVAGADVPRSDFTNGRRQLLLEGAATNSIVASEMTGGVTGRRYHDGIGNVGVLPAGMVLNFGAGCTGHCDLVSLAADARGRKRLRLAFNIANNTGASQYPRFRLAEVPSSAGELWSASLFAHVISTSHPVYTTLEAQSPTGVMANLTLAAGENQVALHGNLFPAGGQTTVRLQFGPTLPTGQTWSAVIEIACPQLEKSARCTSYIPTTGIAATRAADDCQFGPKARAIIARAAASLSLKGEGIWGAQGSIVGGADSRVVGLNGGQTQVVAGNGHTLQIGGAVTVPVPAFGLAAGWDAGGKAGCLNGSAVATSVVPLDAAFASAHLGRGSAFASGWYDELAIYPFRLSDAALAQKAVAMGG